MRIDAKNPSGIIALILAGLIVILVAVAGGIRIDGPVSIPVSVTVGAGR